MSPAPCLIFGAGRTGRGFAAHICQRSNLPFALIDRDPLLVRELQARKRYFVNIMGEPEKSAWLSPVFAAHVEDHVWSDALSDASLCFTAVGGNNLAALAEALAPALCVRFKRTDRPLNIVTCENLTRAALILKEAIAKELSQLEVDLNRFGRCVGFSEAMVLKTCVSSDPAEHGALPLQIDGENFFDLPCDGEAFVGPAPKVDDLKPLPRFQNQLRRKIYTYNCINAIIVYLGALKHYRVLSEAANDPEIAEIALKGGEEASRALIAEYGFTEAEQRQWIQNAMRKFSDRVISDPISRNAVDPARKLGRDDRLIGPALLALKHGVSPDAILRGIRAAMHYREGDEASLLDRFDGEVPRLLAEICKLEPGEELFDLIVKKELR